MSREQTSLRASLDDVLRKRDAWHFTGDLKNLREFREAAETFLEDHGNAIAALTASPQAAPGGDAEVRAALQQLDGDISLAGPKDGHLGDVVLVWKSSLQFVRDLIAKRLASPQVQGVEAVDRIRREANYAGNFIGDERVVLLAVVERVLNAATPQRAPGVDEALIGKLRCIGSLLQQLNAQTAAKAVSEAVAALASGPSGVDALDQAHAVGYRDGVIAERKRVLEAAASAPAAQDQGEGNE